MLIQGGDLSNDTGNFTSPSLKSEMKHNVFLPWVQLIWPDGFSEMNHAIVSSSSYGLSVLIPQPVMFQSVYWLCIKYVQSTSGDGVSFSDNKRIRFIVTGIAM